MSHIDPKNARPEDEEYAKARELLLANGFSKNGITELLTKRWRLRDEIALAALQAVIANKEPATTISQMEEDADVAYRYAQAMLDRRALP